VTLRSLFATRIYEASFAEEPGFAGFNAELEQACRMLAAEDRAGRAWSKAHGYRGYTSYASLDDLPRRASAFGALKTRLDRHAAAYAKALRFDLGGRRLRLDSLWVNVMRPGGAHSGHIHPLSVLSGTVYVAVPQGAGGLRLEDPRLSAMMARPPLSPEAMDEERAFVTLSPRPGTLLMWESWVRHEVMPHAGARTPGGERVSLSFNYAW
jgi:uncharacterized protein (TIGR02466 family)